MGADPHRWHAMLVDGNISNATRLPQCASAVPPMHSPAHTQPLDEGSVVAGSEQLLRVMAHRRQVHSAPLRTPTHLLRVGMVAMKTMHEPMQIPLQVLELKLLTYSNVQP